MINLDMDKCNCNMSGEVGNSKEMNGWCNMSTCCNLVQALNNQTMIKDDQRNGRNGISPRIPTRIHHIGKERRSPKLVEEGQGFQKLPHLRTRTNISPSFTIQLGVRIPFATPAPKVETWGPAPPSGLLGTGRTRFRRASEHLSTSDSRCDPQKASNKNETNFMWYMDVVRVPLKRWQSWSCVPVNCLLVGILFSRLCQGITRANPSASHTFSCEGKPWVLWICSSKKTPSNLGQSSNLYRNI